jgi:hypothetical protein
LQQQKVSSEDEEKTAELVHLSQQNSSIWDAGEYHWNVFCKKKNFKK